MKLFSRIPLALSSMALLLACSSAHADPSVKDREAIGAHLAQVVSARHHQDLTRPVAFYYTFTSYTLPAFMSAKTFLDGLNSSLAAKGLDEGLNPSNNGALKKAEYGNTTVIQTAAGHSTAAQIVSNGPHENVTDIDLESGLTNVVDTAIQVSTAVRINHHLKLADLADKQKAAAPQFKVSTNTLKADVPQATIVDMQTVDGHIQIMTMTVMASFV